jgi:hypothetical protein
VTAALFEPAGSNRWRPTELARGPWDPGACHGGPVGALLARAVEQHDDAPDGTAWHVARLSVELTRPVPVGAALDVSTVTERPGRRVSLVSAHLRSGESVVAHVRALRLRRSDLELPTDTVEPVDPPPGTPEVATRQRILRTDDDAVTFHRDSCEHRFVDGSWDDLGPVSGWIRLLVPVVDGEPPTPLQRVAAAADFGNGISAGVPVERITFVNPDLTIHLHRLPVGEWIGVRSASFYGIGGRSIGTGMAETALYDTLGRIGRSVQSLLVDRR